MKFLFLLGWIVSLLAQQASAEQACPDYFEYDPCTQHESVASYKRCLEVQLRRLKKCSEQAHADLAEKQQELADALRNQLHERIDQEKIELVEQRQAIRTIEATIERMRPALEEFSTGYSELQGRFRSEYQPAWETLKTHISHIIEELNKSEDVDRLIQLQIELENLDRGHRQANSQMLSSIQHSLSRIKDIEEQFRLIPARMREQLASAGVSPEVRLTKSKAELQKMEHYVRNRQTSATAQFNRYQSQIQERIQQVQRTKRDSENAAVFAQAQKDRAGVAFLQEVTTLISEAFIVVKPSPFAHAFRVRDQYYKVLEFLKLERACKNFQGSWRETGCLHYRRYEPTGRRFIEKEVVASIYNTLNYVSRNKPEFYPEMLKSIARTIKDGKLEQAIDQYERLIDLGEAQHD